ncbi:MAG: hypothetical protein ACYC26_04285 [Phycisphaerales bacterium]
MNGEQFTIPKTQHSAAERLMSAQRWNEVFKAMSMRYALIIHNFNHYGRLLTRFASLLFLFTAMLSCGRESAGDNREEASSSAERTSDETIQSLVEELSRIKEPEGEKIFSPPALKLIKLGPRAARAIAPQLNQPGWWDKTLAWLIIGQIVHNTYANSQSSTAEIRDKESHVMDSFDFAPTHTPEQNRETVRRVIEWANRQIAEKEK